MAVRPLEYISSQVPVLQGQPWMMSRPWYMWMMGILTTLSEAGDVVGPSVSVNNQIVLFSGNTGKIIKAATGTGFVTANAPGGVYGTSNASAASKLLGRGSAGGAGIWEEISLGSGLTMSGTTLSATVSVDYVVLSDGANPPTPINDGAGNFIYVAYTP